jgi:hypothetical protein
MSARSPSSTLTAEQLAARTERAVAAAVSAGRGLGLAVSNGQVLHDAFSVDEAAARLGLRPLDRDVLGVMDAARSLQGVASLALTPQLPALREWLTPWLEQWRASPFAGGLGNASGRP